MRPLDALREAMRAARLALAKPTPRSAAPRVLRYRVRLGALNLRGMRFSSGRLYELATRRRGQ